MHLHLVWICPSCVIGAWNQLLGSTFTQSRVGQLRELMMKHGDRTICRHNWCAVQLESSYAGVHTCASIIGTTSACALLTSIARMYVCGLVALLRAYRSQTHVTVRVAWKLAVCDVRGLCRFFERKTTNRVFSSTVWHWLFTILSLHYQWTLNVSFFYEAILNPPAREMSPTVIFLLFFKCLITLCAT